MKHKLARILELFKNHKDFFKPTEGDKNDNGKTTESNRPNREGDARASEDLPKGQGEEGKGLW